MMIHASIHWLDKIIQDLWPMAVDYSAFIWNHMPGIHLDTAPIEVMSGRKLYTTILRNNHV